MQFQGFPLVRIVLCFGLGIIFGHYLPDQFQLPFWFCAFIFCAISAINHFFSRKLNLLYGALAVLLTFQLGLFHLENTKEQYVQSFQPLKLDSIDKFRAEIEQRPQRKAKSYQLKVRVYRVYQNDSSSDTKFKAILYSDTISSANLEKGDLIEVNSSLNRTEPPVNPHSFDYRNYLVYQGIYFQNYIGEAFFLIGHKPPGVLNKKVDEIRSWALLVFDNLIEDKKSAQVAKALVLGERGALEDDVISAYAASGAMHVLAVSGLHVGLIYLLLGSIMKLIPFRPKYRNTFVAIISISILFAYAVLTGLSPSVFRAFVMFSFFALAKAINRPTNTYNILAASALVLLLYDPYLLFGVGFQLSYLAVIGIIYIQPKLYQLIEFKPWFLDKIWAITCVSIAAQLATAPLSMLYFHQFPSYFLISNLFIIPAAFMILLLGIAVLIFYPLTMVSSLLSSILSSVIEVTNYLVFEVSKWWGGTVQGIHLSVIETWFVYGLIISLIFVFFEKRFKAIYVALVCSICFAFSQLGQRIPITQTKELMVYSISGHRAVELREGSHSTLLMDEELKYDADALQFNILPNQRWNHIQDSLPLAHQVFEGFEMVVFEGKSICVLHEDYSSNPEITDIQWDVVIASHAKQLTMFKAHEFVLNSSYRFNQKTDSTVHILSRDGYYANLWK